MAVDVRTAPESSLSVAPTTTPGLAPARRQMRSVVVVAAPLAFFAVLLLAWEWVATSTDSILPTLGQVAAELVDRPGFYAGHLGYTVVNATSGLAIGVGVAFVLAVLIVHVPILNAAIMPVAVLVHATPVVAVAPALVAAFGFSRAPQVIVVALVTFFPMLINAITGLRSAPPDVLEVFRSMAASRLDIFLRLRLPASLSFLFAAARTCVTLALIGAIVAEFQGADRGLGATIVQATTYLDLPQMWVSIALAALVSLVALGAVSLLERAVVRW